jgi:hypothetical protein
MGDQRMRQFLICEDATHAEVVDQLIFAKLQDEIGAQGTCWSGIWSDGTNFGVYWGSPVSDLFGLPEEFPELVITDEVIDKEGNSNWYLVIPAPSIEESI